MSRKKSYLTFTDQFCGAGGSSIGAKRVGIEGRAGLNHWKLATDTYSQNNPEIPVHCTDISACDPRRYPATDLLITSPECTTHSPAGGNRKHISRQSDFFIPQSSDPAVERSRATMFDVVRFAELHKYNAIVVENVVEVLRWDLFADWLRMMHTLGYKHRVVCLNSMFCFPTPQSRDRVYIVFWKEKNRAPRLDFLPPAFCTRCEKNVHALQTWKNGRTVGKYRQQYVYTCPTCRSTVQPYYFAGLNAIDFSLAAERIGDRSDGRRLKERTLERIRYGLEKYGNRQLVIRTNMTSGLETRVRGLEEPIFGQTASWLDGLFSPLLVETAYGHSDRRRVRTSDEPLPTASARASMGVCSPFLVPIQGNATAKGMDDPLPAQLAECAHEMVIQGAPFLATLRGTDDSQRGSWAISPDQPIGTVSAGGIHHALIGGRFAPFLAMRRVGDQVKGVEDAVPTVTTSETQHLLIQGAAQLSMRDAAAMRVAGLDEEMRTQGAAPQAALLSLAPFIVSHYGTNNSSPLDRAVPSVTTIDRHELVSPTKDLRVEDCYFRMLQPHEIGAAMAFPEDYNVLGNKRDKVRQYGNAVTPPAMEWLIRRVAESLHPEIAA